MVAGIGRGRRAHDRSRHQRPAAGRRPGSRRGAERRRRDASRPPICEPGGADPVRAVPWFRLDPVLDDGGALAGQRLVAGSAGERGAARALARAGVVRVRPDDGLVVAGSDDGRRSTIRLLDAAPRLRRADLRDDGPRAAGRPRPDRRALYEHRLERRSRASLGIWRRPIDGLGRAEQILEPLPPNERIGLVFATELFWSDDGATLAVLSCGSVACLTRLVGADGAVRVVDDEAVGETLGMADGRLVGYGRCHGLPCPIVVHDPDAGSTRTIVPAAGLARLVAGPDGPSVAFEDVGHGSVAIVDLGGNRATRSWPGR